MLKQTSGTLVVPRGMAPESRINFTTSASSSARSPFRATCPDSQVIPEKKNHFQKHCVFLQPVVPLKKTLPISSTVTRTKRTLKSPIQDNLLLSSASEIATDIRMRKIKSEDVVSAYIRRIREVQPKINAVVDERFEKALQEARGVDAYLRTSDKTVTELAKEKPFLGVPFSCKSNMSVKEMAWDVGLVTRKGVKAPSDAAVVELLKKAGAIPLVVTNTPELCLSFHTNNKVHGSTCNPYDLSKSPGGSSGGESALLASAGSVIGVGNDICGSLRVPACYTGVFAHKPTAGLILNDGIYPRGEESMLRMLCQGPMCRYAVDLAPMLKVLTGTNATKLKMDSTVDFRDLKIYYLERDLKDPFISPVQPEIKEAIKKAIKYFEKKYGIRAQALSMAKFEYIYLVTSFKMNSSTKRRVGEYLADGKPNFKLWWEFLKAIFGLSDHTADALWFSLLDRLAPTSPKMLKISAGLEKGLAKDMDDLLKENCVLFLPTVTDSSMYPFETISKTPAMSYVSLFNVLGQPVTQCPLGQNKENMPLGMQVVGGLYQDHLTIAVARDLEKAFGGWRTPS